MRCRRAEREEVQQAHHPSQYISRTQVLHESAESPAVGNGMMNGQDQQMVVGTKPENSHAIERTLHKIERLTEGFLHQFFDRFWPPVG